MKRGFRMIAGVWATVVLATGVSAGWAQQPTANAPAVPGGSPKIEFAEPKHDFGKVWVGDKLEHAFKARNIGTADLKILGVRPKCGCTTPSGTPTSIAPGATADFLFKVDGDRYHGDFSTTVDIETNDPVQKVVHLTLAGHMQHYVEATPPGVLFDGLRPDSTAETTVMLKSQTDKPVKLSVRSPINPSPVFKWELKEVTPGKVYSLSVKAAPPYPNKRNIQVLEIETGLPNVPPVKIICTAVAPERLDVEPTVLIIPQNKEAVTRPVHFTINGGKDVKLLEAVSQDPNIKVNVETRKAGRDYMVNLVFPPDYTVPGSFTFLALKTDDSERPEMRVLIRSPALPTPPATRPQALDAFAEARRSATTRPATPQTQPAKPAAYLVGVSAPTIDATTFDNRPVNVGGASNVVRLLVFYASWCPHCKQALPEMENLYRRYSTKGVEIVAVNVDTRLGRMARTEEQILAQYKDLQLSLPLVMDRQQVIGPKYRVVSFPTLVLIGKTGVVEAVHFGFDSQTVSVLSNEFDLLLQGKTRTAFPVVQAAPPTPAVPPAAPPKPTMPLVGSPAPSAVAKTFDGHEIKIGAGSGRVQMLTFYASWCGFCKKAMPDLQKIHEEYKDKGVDVIAINLDGRAGQGARTEEQTLATYKEWKLSMPMTMDPDQKIGQRYQLTGFPTFVIVGSTGTVESVRAGAEDDFNSAVRNELNLLLQGKTRAAFPAPTVASPPARPQNPAMQLAGKPAPSAPAKTFDGKQITVGAGSGRVQLLAFYASWCGFCKKAMPSVQKIYDDYKDKGLEVVAVNSDSPVGRAARTVEQTLATYKEWNLSFPMTMDAESKIGRQFNVSGFPTFFLIGSTGQVEAVYVGGGEVTGTVARAKIDSLLKNRPTAGSN
jgi:thiol-disulfide isomerase/thioredoxin